VSLCCETKINAPLIYEGQDNDTMKTEIQPHSPVAKHGSVSKR